MVSYSKFVKKYKNFPKIESPFIREHIKGKYIVTPKINLDYQWVFSDKKVIASDKLDGTNIAIYIEKSNIIRVFNRETEKFIFNIKQTKWEGAAMEGIANAIQRGWVKNFNDGYHYGELIGETINANRHKIKGHLFVPFSYLKKKCQWYSWITNKYPKDFNTISEWFKEIPSLFNQRIKLPDILAEGLVFYHPDGRMAKIRRDMFDWYSGKLHKI